MRTSILLRNTFMPHELQMDIFAAEPTHALAMKQPASLAIARLLTEDVARRGVSVCLTRVDCEQGLHYRVCPAEGGYFLNAFNCVEGAEEFIKRHKLIRG
jgi:hypothetical protein